LVRALYKTVFVPVCASKRDHDEIGFFALMMFTLLPSLLPLRIDDLRASTQVRHQTPRLCDSAASWENVGFPSYDYSAWSTSLKETMGGIYRVRDCLRRTKTVLPLLKKITAHDFFSLYAVDLVTPCMYFPSGDEGCDLERCTIEAVPDRDVPPALLSRDQSEYEFMLDGWSRKHMPSCFTRYYDLRTCPPRNTGYDGSRVWRFIHNKICFTKDLGDPENSWKRDYNRAISGMHSSVHAHILADLGLTEAGRDAYRRRLRDEPGAITNLYFAYMLALCALSDCRAYLEGCNYLGEGATVRPLMQQLYAAELLSDATVQRAAHNLRSHAASPSAEVWRMRMRHRDLTQMMGCVQCDHCRVYGTVMCLGLGAMMQVLLGSSGRSDGSDPLRLDRVQLAALVATAAKLGAACETVESFWDYDGEAGEDELALANEEAAKAVWLAKLHHPASWSRSASDAFGPDLAAKEEAAKAAWLASGRVWPSWAASAARRRNDHGDY
jgi:hypothetical protein